MNKSQKEENMRYIPESKEFMDQRVPYNIETVMTSLVKLLISNGHLSIDDAIRIFKTGEHYLH